MLDSIPHGIADGESDGRLGVRWRLLGTAVAGVVLTGYLGTAGLLALVVATAEGTTAPAATAFAAALPGWLAAHQVPLSISGAPLGVFPLLPTSLLVLLSAAASARVARRSRLRRPGQAACVIATMGLAHAAVGAGIALTIADTVGASPVDAFMRCGLTAAVGSTAGVANRCGLAYLLWERMEAEVWSGLRAGLLALAAVIGIGALISFAAVCLSVEEINGVLSATGPAGEAFGSMLLSILYLPNAVVAGWSFAAGTGLAIGDYALNPLHFAPGGLPELPLAAALPADAPGSWWALVLLLPPATGFVIGVSCRRAHPQRTRGLISAAVAALVAGIGTGVLAALSGGRLGTAFDPVTLRPVLLGVATSLWFAVPAGLVVWFTGIREDGEPPETPDDLEEAGDEQAYADEPGDEVEPDADLDTHPDWGPDGGEVPGETASADHTAEPPFPDTDPDDELSGGDPPR
ncbi:hypothetical protein SACE_6666 [Saccharopolyspora erythraea NRRL 2338]|uniref:Uncharacterized protein n=2 Tax=Saccharopolyspora erythraea TaxID=1836 RepID=A4FP57_SACEN|nr:hypothetical protein N599_18335 [Saccharopolyspora erythraea D]CAM05832.1 hypothetical protein SACE_6666 [Saccharopolyspora erythraea NRRL 2338]